MLNKNNEYYIVEGWFESTNGMSDNKFYGAMAAASNLLKPMRVVIEGKDAVVASRLAAEQTSKVNPNEISESITIAINDEPDPVSLSPVSKPDIDGLNPKQRAETEHLILELPEVPEQHRKLLDQIKSGNNEILAHDQLSLRWLLDNGWLQQSDTGYVLVDHAIPECITGTGAIAIRPAALGMSDRGGHGRVDNLGPKKVRTKKNMVKNMTKNILTGFGGKTSMPTISQSGGKRGGPR